MRYAAEAEVWLYAGGKTVWHFVSLPVEYSEGIRSFRGPKARGWGSLRVTATVGETAWRTSIFPDRRTGAFILPLKADVRHAENIGQGDRIRVAIEIEF